MRIRNQINGKKGDLINVKNWENLEDVTFEERKSDSLYKK